MTDLQRLARLDTCAVSDALDRLGLAGATTGVRRLSGPGQGPVAGRVRTVRVGPRTDDEPRPHLGASEIVAGGAGEVIVVANDGRTDVSAWGGILSHAARTAGIEAVIVDGACRDIDEAAEIGFPVYARAVVPVSARGRIVQLAAGEQVCVAGVAVRAADYVIADGSGVVFVEQERLAEVLDLAEQIVAREAAMVAAVRAGESVLEVMHDNAFGARGEHDADPEE